MKSPWWVIRGMWQSGLNWNNKWQFDFGRTVWERFHEGLRNYKWKEIHDENDLVRGSSKNARILQGGIEDN